MKTTLIPTRPTEGSSSIFMTLQSFSTHYTEKRHKEPERDAPICDYPGKLSSHYSRRSIKSACALFLLAGLVLIGCNDDPPSPQLPHVIDTIAPNARPLATAVQLFSDAVINDIDTLQPVIDLIRLRTQEGQKSPMVGEFPLETRVIELSKGRPPIPQSRHAIHAHGNLRVFVAPENRLTTSTSDKLSEAFYTFRSPFSHCYRPDTTSPAVAAMPVFILNVSDSVVGVMAILGAVPIIQEALDRDGVWKPIEWWQFPMCGNSFEIVDLAPGELILTRMYHYTGSFATQLRVKVFMGSDDILVSAPFPGSIDPRQFNRVRQNIREYFESFPKEPAHNRVD